MQVELAVGEAYQRLVEDNQDMKDKLKQMDSKLQVTEPRPTALFPRQFLFFGFRLLFSGGKVHKTVRQGFRIPHLLDYVSLKTCIC